MSPDDRRATIVEVALPLLQEHGAGLTTKQVAEAAGIAEGTLFRAFGTKDELVHACATAVFDTKDVVERLRAVDRGQSLDDRLADGRRHHARARGPHHRADVDPPRRGRGPAAAPRGEAAPTPPDERPRGRRRRSSSSSARTPTVCASTRGDVVTVLGQLTLASAHPMFPGRAMTPAEIVSVVLDGTRKAGTR